MIRPLIVSLLLLAAGCTMVASFSADRLLDRHYVLGREGAWRLTGPFDAGEATSPVGLDLSSRQEVFHLTLRGIRSTGVPRLDHECLVTLSLATYEEAYLRADCTIDTAGEKKRGVLYTPANRLCTGKDAAGRLQYENLTYVMPQLLMIAYGYCLVDHSDTDYPLYEVFRRAEELARKARRGYWAKAEHRQAGTPTPPAIGSGSQPNHRRAGPDGTSPPICTSTVRQA